MKKNWIAIVLGVLLVVAIGLCIVLAKNGGTLSPQPTPTAEPTPSTELVASPTPSEEQTTNSGNNQNNEISVEQVKNRIVGTWNWREAGNPVIFHVNGTAEHVPGDMGMKGTYKIERGSNGTFLVEITWSEASGPGAVDFERQEWQLRYSYQENMLTTIAGQRIAGGGQLVKQ